MANRMLGIFNGVIEPIFLLDLIRSPVKAILAALEWLLNSIFKKFVKKVPFRKSCHICLIVTGSGIL